MGRTLKIAINCALVALLATGIGACAYIDWSDEQRKRAEFEELTKPHQNMVDAFNRGYAGSSAPSEEEGRSAGGASEDERVSALAKAFEYLAASAFSEELLVAQLEYEGFSREAALEAVDLCGADWDEEAVRDAEMYLSVEQISREDLISYLEADGFTHEQAVHGADEALS